MGITHIADLTGIIGTTMVPQAGFGVPLLVGFHAHFPERVRQYSGDPSGILADMEDDGFETGENLYKMAQRLLSQQVAPRVIKIGRLTSALDQQLTLTPVNTTDDTVYSLVFYSAQGTETATYTVDSDTAAQVATALHTAINAFTVLDDLVSTDNTGSITVDSATAGNAFRMEWTVNGRSRPGDLDLLDATADVSIATQLSAIETEDPDWYGLFLEIESPAISEAVGDWVSTRKHAYLAATSDADATESGTATDIGSVMLADANNRVAAVFEPWYRDYTNLAMAGRILPLTPGKATWANKTLVGVHSADLPGGLFTALQNKRYTVYRALNATLAATQGGHVGGTYRYLDILRGFDWTEARGEEALANLLLSNDKIPFTVEGLALVKQALAKVVADAISNGVLSAGTPGDANDPVPAIVLPRIGDPGADLTARTARELSEVKITGRFQGAIHSVLGTIVLGF